MTADQLEVLQAWGQRRSVDVGDVVYSAGERVSLDPSRRELVGRFRYVGGARKVVGVGSVGTRAWVVLLLGRDDSDPLLMQVKEAEPSVMERYLGACGYANAPERVVQCERLMQASSDILLGWLRCSAPTATKATTTCVSCAIGRNRRAWNRWVRSYSPITVDRARTSWPARTPVQVIASRSRATSAAVTRRHRVHRFAEAYARQNERDYATLRDAVASGRVTAEPDL